MNARREYSIQGNVKIKSMSTTNKININRSSSLTKMEDLVGPRESIDSDKFLSNHDQRSKKSVSLLQKNSHFEVYDRCLQDLWPKIKTD